MDDLWLMIRILLIVVAWGGLLLLAGYGLEMLSRLFGRRPSAEAPAAPDDTSGTSASS
jgi:hypothetical protein